MKPAKPDANNITFDGVSVFAVDDGAHTCTCHGANACIGKINPTTKTITFGSASQPPQSGHLTYFQYPEVFVFDSSTYGEMVIVSWWHSNNSATYMTVLVGPTGDSTTAPTWSSSNYSTSAGNNKFGRSMTRLGDRLIYSYISGF